MAIISVSLPADGETADVADVNTPITTIVNEFNGNIDNANIKSGAAIDGSKLADTSITNAKLETGAGEPGGAWNSWTPTWSNLTISSSTVSAYYKQVGKTTFIRMRVTGAGSFAVSGDVEFTLPAAPLTTAGYVSTDAIGAGFVQDVSAGTFYFAQLWIGTTTTRGRILVQNAAPTYLTAAGLSASAPMVWANGDIIDLCGSYEAA
jgi:hypothetical protein